MAVLDELLVGLGFDYDDAGLERFRSDLDGTVGLIKRMAQAAIGAATALGGMAIASTAATDEQGKLADEIGVNVSELDALQHAAVRAGATAESMGQGLRELAIRASEAARGTGTGVEAFGLLGISATDASGQVKPMAVLMQEVSGAMSGLNKAKQIELADKLGLKDSIRLLQQGPEEIRALIEHAQALGVTTAEDAKLAGVMQDRLGDLWKILKHLGRLLSRVIVPTMAEVSEAFIDWWKANRQIIEQNLPLYVERAAAAFRLLGVVLASIIALRVAKIIGGAVLAMRRLSVAAMMVNASVLLLPAILTALVAAFILLAQDVYTFFKGGDSYVGRLLEAFPRLKDAAESVRDAFRGAAEYVEELWLKIKKTYDIAAKFLSLGDDEEGSTNRQRYSGTGRGGMSRLQREANNQVMAAINEKKTVQSSDGGGGFRVTPVPGKLEVNTVNITIPGIGNSKEIVAAVVGEFEQMATDVSSAVAN